MTKATSATPVVPAVVAPVAPTPVVPVAPAAAPAGRRRSQSAPVAPTLVVPTPTPQQKKEVIGVKPIRVVATLLVGILGHYFVQSLMAPSSLFQNFMLLLIWLTVVWGIVESGVKKD